MGLDKLHSHVVVCNVLCTGHTAGDHHCIKLIIEVHKLAVGNKRKAVGTGHINAVDSGDTHIKTSTDTEVRGDDCLHLLKAFGQKHKHFLFHIHSSPITGIPRLHIIYSIFFTGSLSKTSCTLSGVLFLSEMWQR